MKKILSFLLCWRFKRHFAALCATQLLTLDFSLQAQAPQGIPYQAIARNASGVAIANTAVKVRFSIRDSIATGAIKYQETHSTTTSALGLFSVNVGMGTVVSGTFSGINWGKNAKFLQVELNTTGGTTYTDLGTTQMMSVPYALHSGSADAIKLSISATGDTVYSGGGNFIIIPRISGNWNDGILSDIEGNLYRTVTIGNQIWMKENLKTSKYRNGDAIITNLSSNLWISTTNGAYAVYNDFSGNNTTYGKLYNWYAVADSRGVCPSGWHVPSDVEWKILEYYLGMLANDLNLEGFRGFDQNVGGKMKAISNLWVGNVYGNNNSSGFSGLPGGAKAISGTTDIAGNNGCWWSSTEVGINSALYRILSGYAPDVGRYVTGKKGGLSVRCLKD